MAHKPTYEQAAVYDGFSSLSPGDNASVLAAAGAGKTTTLQGIAKNTRERGMLLCFNKSNAADARRKLRLTMCEASTLHKLAYVTMAQKFRWGFETQDTKYTYILNNGLISKGTMPDIKGMNDMRFANLAIKALVKYCESDSLKFTDEFSRAAIVESYGDPNFLVPGKKKEAAQEALEALTKPVWELGRKTFGHANENGTRFLDMYVKALHRDPSARAEAFRRMKYLMLDEAQDSNRVTMAIFQGSGLKTIMVGDPYQQLYSWRGAVNAFDHVSGPEFHLSQSFRFGDNIAEIARHILNCHPSGPPARELVGLGRPIDLRTYEGTKIAAVCRTNAGVIEEALKFMKAGKTVQVEDIESLILELKSAEALSCGEPNKVRTETFKAFDDWEEAKQVAEEGDPTVRRIVKIIEDNDAKKIYELADRQKQDANEGRTADAICMTAHRSKGGEWPIAFLGGDWPTIPEMMQRWNTAKNGSASEEQAALEDFNGLYVAATRGQTACVRHERILFPEVEKEPLPEPDPEPAPM